MGQLCKQPMELEKKKKRRRGKKKKISIFYSNINGAKSKYESLKNIIEEVNPAIVTLTETKLGKSSKIQKILCGYKLFSRTVKLGKGGLLIGIRHNTFRSSLEVTTSEDKNVMAVRVSVSEKLAYRLILAYGPQETEPLETRENFMTEVSVEVQNCEDNGEVPIILGDFNAKVEKEGNQVMPLSGNGRLLCEMVKEHELDIMNFSNVCEGRWTHEIRTTGAKSVLDYVITSTPFSSSIRSMVIDEDCVYCPFAVRKRGARKEVFSDHNSIIIEAKVEINKKSSQEKQYTWKLQDEGKVQLLQMTDIENYNPPARGGSCQDQYDTFESEVKRLLKSTALCIKTKKKPPQSSEKCPQRLLGIFKMLSNFGTHGKIQRKVASQYKKLILDRRLTEVRKERAKSLKESITSLTISGRFTRQQFWKVRKSVYRKFENCASVFDENGREVFEDVMIRKAYEKEFVNRLSHRKIHPTLVEYENKTNLLAKTYVEEAECTKGPPITMEELDVVIGNLKSGSPGSDNIPTDFYTNIGVGFKAYLLDILNEVKVTSWTPQQWECTLIRTIYKNKGTRKQLKNHRGIFLTQILAKLFERIILMRKKEAMDKVTKWQSGSRRKRGSLDNLFLFQSCIDHAKHMNKPLYVTVYDFAQCFDALWLEDCIVSLWNIGIRDETLSTLYNMNKRAVIQVKTPVGTSEKFVQETIVKQGTVSGPPMCSTSTAEFVKLNKVRGFSIGDFSISSMVLVDDILNANGAPDDVLTSHENMEEFSEVKRLPVNGKKCFILPINVKDVSCIPCLKHYGTRLEIVNIITYLGNMFNSKGSNKDNIEDRVNKAKGCMVESLSLCSEITLGVFMIPSLLLTHNMIFVPTLLYGAQTWTNLTVEDQRLIKTVQLQFLKRILRVPNSACNSVLFLETGVLPVLYEVHILKLMFLHHILTMEDDDPVKRIYYEQLKIPEEKNWANELVDLREKYELLESDTEVEGLLKEEWKGKVHTQVKTAAVIQLNVEKNQLSKSSVYPDADSIKTAPYIYHLTVSHSCLLFRLRSRIIDVKELHRYKYGDNQTCRCCEDNEETVGHMLKECPGLVSDSCEEGDEYSEDLDVLKKVVCRIEEFVDKIDNEDERGEE